MEKCGYIEDDCGFFHFSINCITLCNINFEGFIFLDSLPPKGYRKFCNKCKGRYPIGKTKTGDLKHFLDGNGDNACHILYKSKKYKIAERCFDTVFITCDKCIACGYEFAENFCSFLQMDMLCEDISELKK